MIDNEAHMLALKRVLDTPRDHGIPNEHQSVVKEGELTYFKLENRAYVAAGPRALVELVLQGGSSGSGEPHVSFEPRRMACDVSGARAGRYGSRHLPYR